MTEHPFVPDYCVRPGETVKEWAEENNMSLRVLATACGRMPLDIMQSIVDGKRRITDKLAAQLYLGTGISKGFWLKLESNYRDALRAGKKDRAQPGEDT